MANVQNVKDLIQDTLNANRGTDRGREVLRASLQECGAGRSVLVDREGRIIAGNKTVEQAEALGIPIRVVVTKGDELVVVQREDLDLLEDERARQLAYLDNRAGEVGLDWDAERVREDILSGLDLATAFTGEELGAFLEEESSGFADRTLEEIDVEDLPDKPLWCLIAIPIEDLPAATEHLDALRALGLQVEMSDGG